MDEYTHDPAFDPADVISSEIIEHEVATNERTIARRAALQVLYEVDSAGHKVGDVITSQLAGNPLSPKSSRYMRRIVLGVLGSCDSLDEVIQRYAPEWPLDQVAIIDRNILRLALYELAVQKNVPVKVAIDEAVQLARIYGAEGSSRFVNGVLGTLSGSVETIREELAGRQDER